MRTIYRTTNLFLAICLVISALAVLPTQPVRAAEPAEGQELTSPAAYLNPNGTLKLDANFSGAFDIGGWDVQLDPVLGPVFSPLATQDNWDAVGAEGGAFNDDVSSIVVNGTDIYVGGWFNNLDSIPEADSIAM